MSTFSTALLEWNSLAPATCKINGAEPAIRVDGTQAFAVNNSDDTFGLVNCYSLDEDNLAVFNGQGVCVHILVSYTTASSKPNYFESDSATLSPKNSWNHVPYMFRSDVLDLSAALQYTVAPKAYIDTFPKRNFTDPEQQQLFSDYAASLTGVRMVATPNGYEDLQYRACAYVDCRPNGMDSVNATRDYLLNMFATDVPFDCYVDTSGTWTSSLLKTLFGIPKSDPAPSGDFYPVVIDYEFQFSSEAQNMSTSLGLMVFVCSCYYFLLCREWWCQMAWCQRLQYF